MDKSDKLTCSNTTTGVLVRRGRSQPTVADASSPGVLVGFGVPGDLRSSGGDQAVMCQFLHPQVPGGAAVHPIVPRRDAIVVTVAGTVGGEDQRVGRGRDACGGRKVN